MVDVYVPRIKDKDNPEYWFSRHPVKWQDENGDYHKTLVTPIKYLATGHLRNIIFKQKGSLEDIEDKILYAQLKNVIHEYKSREA